MDTAALKERISLIFMNKITYLKFKLPDDFQTRPYDPTPYGDNMVRPFQEGDI